MNLHVLQLAELGECVVPEAFVEKWQEFEDPSVSAATTEEKEMKILVALCNLLKMNLIASQPLCQGRVKEIDVPSITAPQDPIAKHL